VRERTEYNAHVIKDYADRLYTQAASMAALYALIGILLTVGLTILVVRAGDVRVLAIAAAVGGLIGGYIGSGRAAALRLEAQIALCQVQIEENTRAAVPPPTGSPETPVGRGFK